MHSSLFDGISFLPVCLAARSNPRFLATNLGSWRWTRGYVDNVAAAIALAVVDERAAGRIYNVGELAPSTWAEWARKTALAVGWQDALLLMPPERLPAHLVSRLDTRQHLVTESSRIRQDLGYTEPVAPEEALRRTIAWERANPPREFAPARFDYAAEDAALAGLERAGLKAREYLQPS